LFSTSHVAIYSQDGLRNYQCAACGFVEDFGLSKPKVRTDLAIMFRRFALSRRYGGLGVCVDHAIMVEARVLATP
jgi:hypothetical protein